MTAGGKQALHTACLASLRGGRRRPRARRRTGCRSPRWSRSRAPGSVFVPTSAAPGFRLTAADVARAATPATRGIIVNTPNNPTGAVMEPAEIDGIVRLAASRGWTVLFDECYDRFVFEGRHLSAAALARGVPRDGSRGRNAVEDLRDDGLARRLRRRPKPLIELMGRIVGHATSNVCSVTQQAALAALTRPDEAARRDRGHAQGVRAPAGVPDPGAQRPAGRDVRAARAAPSTRSRTSRRTTAGRSAGSPSTDSQSFAKALLETVAVAVTPGVAFGEDRCVRISFATSLDRIEEALRRLRAS